MINNKTNAEKIYCKSSLDQQQLKHRTEIDSFIGIEIQLLGDFVCSDKDVSQYLQDIKPYIKNIRAIHVPLKKGEDLLELQMLDNKEKQNLFYKICTLAQEISKINNQDTLIVIHNRWNLADLNFHEETYRKIKQCLDKALKENPNIKISIENVIPFLIGSKNFTNGCLPDYVEVVKDLRKNLDTDRIGTVIDTCHAWVTMHFYKIIEESENIGLELKMEDYFKANEGICFLLHLCDVSTFGYKKNAHGVTFTEESKDKLKEVINLHAMYTESAAITIEVLEDDYTNCKNYLQTRKMIDTI